MKKKQRHARLLTLFGIFLALAIVLILFMQKAPPNSALVNNQASSFKTYISRDLAISFQYPEDWHITDENFGIMLTNYKHDPHSNYRPKANEIEIQIRRYNLCQPTLEQDLIFWGCGEGKQVMNKILDKNIYKLQSGIFSKYLILYPQTNRKQTEYYLQKGDKILQISKEPDPSRFEKEFDEIINSITFL